MSCLFQSNIMINSLLYITASFLFVSKRTSASSPLTSCAFYLQRLSPERAASQSYRVQLLRNTLTNLNKIILLSLPHRFCHIVSVAVTNLMFRRPSESEINLSWSNFLFLSFFLFTFKNFICFLLCLSYKVLSHIFL